MDIPKSEWPPGPWHDEPDEFEWIDPATGYTCLIRRSQMGMLLGYVVIPGDHPLASRSSSSMPDDVNSAAHGGVTYSGIMRAPRSEDKDQFVVGFDCGHAFDVMPAMDAWRIRERQAERYARAFKDNVYRDIAYVREHVTALAAALKAHE